MTFARFLAQCDMLLRMTEGTTTRDYDPELWREAFGGGYSPASAVAQISGADTGDFDQVLAEARAGHTLQVADF